MANGVIVQFAVPAVIAAVLACLLIMYKRGKSEREPSHAAPQVRPVVEKSKSMPPSPPPVPRTIPTETKSAPAPVNNTANPPSSEPAPKPTVVVKVQEALTAPEDRNERILAGISENIRKSLQTRPVPQHSPIPYSESKPRNTEYVRIKKEIITPHGDIRFSILKDWVSINMLAVFRRASLDWKTPDDLIAFLPSYLEPDVEVLDGQVLLIGTPGHNEKLAVPIRSLDAASSLRDCFDFVTDIRTAANTPAVLLRSHTDFEVVSRGVITNAAFMNGVEQDHTEVKRLLERSPEALQKSYSAALRGMESTIAAER